MEDGLNVNTHFSPPRDQTVKENKHGWRLFSSQPLFNQVAMCCCCSSALCIQQTNSITWKGSARDRGSLPVFFPPHAPSLGDYYRVQTSQPSRQTKRQNRRDYKVSPRVQLADGIEQDWKPNMCLNRAGKTKCCENFPLGRSSSIFTAAFGAGAAAIHQSCKSWFFSSTLTKGICGFDSHLLKGWQI